MPKEIQHPNLQLFQRSHRAVPLAVRLVVILVILAIPLKIISYGFLPPSDALRQAAKAVSGKPWPAILMLNPFYKIDHEFGWQFFLREVFLWSHWDAGTLVHFSIILLFLLAGWSALPWLRRPEAWLIALIAMALASDLVMRFCLGRPFLVTIAGLLTILFFWKAQGTLPPKRWTAVWIGGVIGICIFVHGVWYLWVLPVAAFFLAGEIQWGVTLAIAWAIGVVLGTSLTGHPMEACYVAMEMALRAFTLHTTESTLATEFQPSSGELFGLIILGGLVILRQLAKLNARPFARDPVFWLACMSWILSFKAARFTEDWGWPALLVLITWDLQLFLQSRFAADSFKRLGLTCMLALTLFMVFTNDIGSRWTQNQTWTVLDQSNPALNDWLPERGGIFYSVDMTLFYQTFFENPNADWRYMLGFEPALMPDEDFKIYHDILWTSGDSDAYQPWIRKMTSADRLVLRGNANGAPDLPQLEWAEWGRGANAIWIGRLPRAKSNATSH